MPDTPEAFDDNTPIPPYDEEDDTPDTSNTPDAAGGGSTANGAFWLGQPLSPEIGSVVDLADYDPRYQGRLGQRIIRSEVYSLRQRLYYLQAMLYAQRELALLIIFQAMDGAGKDSMMTHIVSALNPMLVKLAHFRAPTEEEQQYDFLWRIHKAVPPKGHIGLFNRSHYEDVLVARVNDLVPEVIWRARYDHINNFERLLVDSGTCIIKFYLHLSKAEQKKRFQWRLKRVDKLWKFSENDFAVRERWDDYMQAYAEAITQTHTDIAPWYIVPADTRWYRNYVVLKTIVQTLEDLPLAFPDPAIDLTQLEIPD